MSYATQQDMQDRFGLAELLQLTDRDNIPPSTVNTSVLGRALADADALIDSYLAGRYQLPLTVVPEILVKTGCDIARFYLFGSNADIGGTVERGYKLALSWLESIASGSIQLNVGADAPIESGGSIIKFSSRPCDLTRENLRGL